MTVSGYLFWWCLSIGRALLTVRLVWIMVYPHFHEERNCSRGIENVAQRNQSYPVLPYIQREQQERATITSGSWRGSIVDYCLRLIWIKAGAFPNRDKADVLKCFIQLCNHPIKSLLMSIEDRKLGLVISHNHGKDWQIYDRN